MKVSYLPFFFFFAVESTLLLALLTGDRCTVLLLIVGAARTLFVFESCNDIAVFACRRVSICFHVQIAFLAGCDGAALTVIDYKPRVIIETTNTTFSYRFGSNRPRQ